jgi:hypothetical protein
LTDAITGVSKHVGSWVQECGQPLQSGGPVLYELGDDDRRTCRALWNYAERHLWWAWAESPNRWSPTRSLACSDDIQR